MLTEFKKGKKYRFSKKLHDKAHPLFSEYEWTEVANGLRVNVINKNYGEVHSEIATLGVSPEWCKRVIL